MARTKPADQRRDDLVGAAEAAFLERGVGATTVDHIVANAGVAKGTFYLYFRTKADVLLAVRQRFNDRYIRQLEEAIAAAGDDWGARLDAAVVAGLADHREGRTLHDVLFVDSSPPAPHDLEDEANRLVAVFADLLDAGVAAGAYTVADTATTAMLLFNTLHGVYNPVWSGSNPPDDAVLVAAAQTIFRRATGHS